MIQHMREMLGMPSPADRQAEANEDVERIARELFDSFNDALGNHRIVWQATGECLRDAWRSVARDLLLRDVIRVGRRPNVERPMEGQTTIDDEATDGK